MIAAHSKSTRYFARRDILASLFATVTAFVPNPSNAKISQRNSGDVAECRADNQLDAIFQEAAAGRISKVDFIEALLRSDIYLAGTAIEPTGGESKEASVYNLYKIQKPSGEIILPIFTSISKLRNILGADAPALSLRGCEAFTLFRSDTVVLNYGFVPSITWSPNDISNIIGAVKSVR